ncbi:HPr family phosphocarrier protein [Iocasia frigidifontis]|uniref:HPr family phosphocarrier protein n=1 Tax=Iocasia fonsfrigidae TaxID=2682810 RepID=A0A8A7KMG5_9FIRM|nr:HPr family phosphocarrier protein [Iocasia fonsfrigidae]QTL99264.1 HPr family phosphocarrier protein [Iocasia fonsfrigidae]
MISEKVIVKNKIGFHARPASLLVKAADKFKSNINIIKGDKTAKAKSMISLLTLRVKMNDEIVITAEGCDENEAVYTLVELINSKFGEE